MKANQTTKNYKLLLSYIQRYYKYNFSLIFKSITVDNGVEFLDMAGLEKSVYKQLYKRTIICCAHPYCLLERGSNENNSKLIRKFIKKFGYWINNYHGKLYNYKSADDIFYESSNNCLNCCNRF